MVSLGRSFNMSSGARFLTGGGTGFAADERLVDPELTVQNNKQFEPLWTVRIFGFHQLLSTCISIVGIVLAIFNTEEKKCQSYFIILYLRAAFWLLTFIFEWYIKKQHERLRLNGYLEFHRNINGHRGITFYIVSLWNTVVYILETLMHQYYGKNFEEYCIQTVFSPIVYVTAFSVLECIILFFINGIYIRKVNKFNQSTPSPDAMKNNSYENGSVGLADVNGRLFELLEEQADIIDFYKDHNFKLSRKLMQLNAQVRNIAVPQSN